MSSFCPQLYEGSWEQLKEHSNSNCQLIQRRHFLFGSIPWGIFLLSDILMIEIQNLEIVLSGIRLSIPNCYENGCYFLLWFSEYLKCVMALLFVDWCLLYVGDCCFFCNSIFVWCRYNLLCWCWWFLVMCWHHLQKILKITNTVLCLKVYKAKHEWQNPQLNRPRTTLISFVQ